MEQKRVVSIQDISCFGKCSLTVALPIISAMGVETAIIPTAVLSTHTGGFTGFTFTDLSDDIPAIEKHWLSLGLKFDAVYTGYLGSIKQIEMIENFFDCFDALKVVDPVMADHGKLYTGFTVEYAKRMAKMCGKADIILPNITEACLMTDTEYVDSGYDKSYIDGLIQKLAKLGAKKVCITGVSYKPEELGVVLFDTITKKTTEYYSKRIDAQYHGTGDCFASSFVGAVMNGKTMYESIKIAAEFTAECIDKTVGDKQHWYGVKFENCLGDLIKML
ncbi:MAG: pyridoxamine kinase [Clostridia bacterium]|nr:pyridoxamine kinase [Clostridia bacterium]